MISGPRPHPRRWRKDPDASTVTDAGLGRRAALILVLAALVFSTEVLKVSTTRLYPNYDEISYLALGRQVSIQG